MLAEYAGILVFLALGLVLVGAMLGVHLLLGPRREFAEKQEPFECGEKQIVSPRQRYAVKFYLVAMLFILFDVEVVFLYPWAVVYKDMLAEHAHLIFGSMMLFLLLFLVGFVYEIKKKAFDWKS